jgi:fused signal recognition particle receptor
MFGFLKKKLKEAADKISTAISSDKPEEVEEPKKIEQQIEQKPIEHPVEEIKKEQPIEEKSEEQIEEPEEQIEEPEEQIEEPEEQIEEPEEQIEEPEEQIEEQVKEEPTVEKIEIPPEESKQVEETLEQIEEPDEFDNPSPFVEEPKPVEEASEEPDEFDNPSPFVEESKQVEETLEQIEEPDEFDNPSPFVEEPKPEPKPEPEPEVEQPEPPKKKSFFDKLTSIVTEKKIKEEEVKPILEEMKFALLQSDVALEVAETICDDLKNALVGQSVKRGQVEKIISESLKNSITGILDQPKVDLLQLSNEKKPLSIVFLGFNGTGKTTTIARLGKMFTDNNKKVLFAAADTFRAAAIHQLEEHGKNLKIEVIKHDYGADPAAVIFDAVKAATARDVDVVLADTAGRSQANLNLMEELKKIIRVNKPDLKILVVDCLTGNDAVDQARLFNEAVGVDGIIMTKADVYEKGGAVLSASHAINKPILYIGIGQDYQDIEKFDVDKVVQNLLE